MKTLRLPLSVSTTSLRSAIDTFSCLARSLTPAAKSHSGVPGCGSCQCPPLLWPLLKRRQEALSSFQGTLSHICPALSPRPDHRVRLLTLWCCSRRHKDGSSSNSSIFRGSVTRLLYSLHTLEAAISDDSPMLASGRLPPFPGGLSGPTGFLQRISTSGYPIVSFLSGFILTLYAGFELELAGAERSGAASRNESNFPKPRLRWRQLDQTLSKSILERTFSSSSSFPKCELINSRSSPGENGFRSSRLSLAIPVANLSLSGSHPVINNTERF